MRRTHDPDSHCGSLGQVTPDLSERDVLARLATPPSPFRPTLVDLLVLQKLESLAAASASIAGRALRRVLAPGQAGLHLGLRVRQSVQETVPASSGLSSPTLRGHSLLELLSGGQLQVSGRRELTYTITVTTTTPTTATVTITVLTATMTTAVTAAASPITTSTEGK